MDRIIIAGLLISIVAGAAAFKARKNRKHVAANVYGWTGIAGYATAVGYMI